MLLLCAAEVFQSAGHSRQHWLWFIHPTSGGKQGIFAKQKYNGNVIDEGNWREIGRLTEQHAIYLLPLPTCLKAWPNTDHLPSVSVCPRWMCLAACEEKRKSHQSAVRNNVRSTANAVGPQNIISAHESFILW